MTLADIASLSSAISGLAVLGSLVYLGIQVKQTERNQQAIIRQSRATRTIETDQKLIDSSLADLYNRGRWGREEISETELTQFFSYIRGFFNNWQDSFYQHQNGLIDETDFQAIVRSIKSSISFIGIRIVYRRYRGSFGVEFEKFCDELIADTHLFPEYGSVAQWKTEVAAEKAGAAA